MRRIDRLERAEALYVVGHERVQEKLNTGPFKVRAGFGRELRPFAARRREVELTKSFPAIVSPSPRNWEP